MTTEAVRSAQLQREQQEAAGVGELFPNPAARQATVMQSLDVGGDRSGIVRMGKGVKVSAARRFSRVVPVFAHPPCDLVRMTVAHGERVDEKLTQLNVVRFKRGRSVLFTVCL